MNNEKMTMPAPQYRSLVPARISMIRRLVAVALIHLLLWLCCFLSWPILPVSARKNITHLPGFHGPLPFALETGYVEVDEKNGVQLFYYFIQSERKPKEDPLMLWLTGGPGCSGLSGLVYEIGPLSFDFEGYTGGLPTLLYKSDSWTKVSSIIFVDSPVGTGFSYSNTEEGYASTDTNAVSRLLIFIRKWFDEHPQFLSNPLYIAGDSYCGLIIPRVALRIARDIESGDEPLLNLKGYIAGNPLTDRKCDGDAKVPFAHGMGLISDELYELAKKSCRGKYSSPKNAQCQNSLQVIGECTKDINIGHILEPYCPEPQSPHLHKLTEDRRKILVDDTAELAFLTSAIASECRAATYVLSKIWANKDTVRETLGIHKGTVPSWNRCNFDIPHTRDIASAVGYHSSLTTKGYRALIYSGDHDMYISVVGTRAWIRSLNFSIVDDWRPWYVGGQVAGYTRAYSNNFTFATVKGAGHTAPEYKPKECLAMFERWLSGDPL